ncbi:MAG: T9SS type A sorting domain-containing protein [Rhodothermales bacterium]
MKRNATILSLLFLVLAALQPARAQECAPSSAARYFSQGIESYVGVQPQLTEKARVQRVAAIESHLPADAASRCLALAGMNLLPESRRVAADGDLTSIVDQEWTGVAWVDTARVLLTYSDSDFPSEWISQMWNGTEWVNEFRAEFTFENGNEASFLFQTWDGTDWVNETRGLSTFSPDGLETSSLSEVWDADAGEWMNLSQSTTTYDEGALESVTTTQFWDNGVWMNASRTTTQLDDQRREIEIVSETWNDTDEVWESFQSTQTEWSTDGLTATATTKFVFDGIEFNSTRITTTYDAIGNVLQEVYEVADFISGDFTPSSRTTYAYDGVGNDIQVLTELWDSMASEWVNEELETNVFDGDNDITESIWQVWSEDVAGKQGAAGWLNDSRSLYNYGTSTAREGVPGGFAVSAIDLFPNPTRDRVTVDVTMANPGYLLVEVYDLLGRRVATLSDATAPAGVQQLRWNADGQPAGLYLVRLEAAGETQTHAVTVIR